MILSNIRYELIIECILLLLISLLIKSVRYEKRKRWIHGYMEAFRNIFLKELSIKKTLEGLLVQYEKDKKVREAIMAALAYLEYSLLRDYQSALLLLDDVFKDEEVRKMHATIIQIIKKQRVSMIPVRKEKKEE